MNRPLPTPNADSKPFWEACGRNELLYQCCERCGHAQGLPRRTCGSCHSTELGWRKSQRRGAIYSHTTVYRAPTAAFRADVPYVLALVDLEEGFRLMMQVTGCDPGAVHIGQAVQVGFVELGGAVLPRAEVQS